MNAREIFEKSVVVMKQLLTKDEMMGSIKRAKERGEEGNQKLLSERREQINGLVRKIADAKGSKASLDAVPRELTDAMVVRYLSNREIFMKTFPEGIEDIDTDPVSIWASIMISPGDEGPLS